MQQPYDATSCLNLFYATSGSVSVAEFRRQGDPDWGSPANQALPARSIKHSK